MIDRLIDLIIDFIGLAQVYFFVDEFDRGVVLRCGKYNRRVNPGFHWIIPLGFERHITTNVKPEPIDLGVQSLHTKDGYAINIQAYVRAEIVDEVQYLIHTENPDETIAASCSGLISDTVQSTDWKQISTHDFAKSLRGGMSRRARKCGSKILDVYIQDCSNGDAQRYWHEGIEL